MNYTDIINSQIQTTLNTYIANYISSGPKVVIYKYLKDETKINPIYNEEINSRIYARGFYIPCIYKTNPFVFNFSETIPSEVDDSNLSFIFNFDSLVQTINGLKNSACNLKITPLSESWLISKTNTKIKFVKLNTTPTDTDKEIVADLKTYDTLDKLSSFLNSTPYFYTFYDDDDYTACIPNFKQQKMTSSIILKTFNNEFKNCSNLIEQGDLIYIPTTNALYEVNASFPVNNVMYKYMNLQCNANRTFAYVNYDRLKNYNWGLNIEDAGELKNIVKPKEDKPLADDFYGKIAKRADKVSKYNNSEFDIQPPQPMSNEVVVLNDTQLREELNKALNRVKQLDDEGEI